MPGGTTDGLAGHFIVRHGGRARIVLAVVVATTVAAKLLTQPGQIVGYLGYVDPRDNLNAQECTWKDHFETPGKAKDHRPQGMTYIEIDGKKRLVLAVSENDQSGRFYVYEIKNGKLTLETKIPTPEDAVHTSGLDWDGTNLWAIDFKSHRIYKIDFRESLAEGSSVVTHSVDTGLTGSGSIALMPSWRNGYIAISDFRETGRTYLVPLADAFVEKPVPEKAEYSYKNGYFVQGMMFDGTHLFETNNHLGSAMIYQIDPDKTVDAKDFRAGVVGIFAAPGFMVEDIATDGETVWTTDERTFRLYSTPREARKGSRFCRPRQ